MSKDIIQTANAPAANTLRVKVIISLPHFYIRREIGGEIGEWVGHGRSSR